MDPKEKAARDAAHARVDSFLKHYYATCARNAVLGEVFLAAVIGALAAEVSDAQWDKGLQFALEAIAPGNPLEDLIKLLKHRPM